MAHILLAEDDDSMRHFLTAALIKEGFNVTECHNGDDAFEKLNQDNAHFDLLLTDIVMPGMDGIELAKRAVKKHSSIKVMYITGFSAVTAKQSTDVAKDAKVLAKPFHLKDLIDQVSQELNQELNKE